MGTKEPTFTTGLEKMYIPALGERRNRKYKGLYHRARMVAWCLFALLTLCAYLLGMSLYGGHVLQQRLLDKSITVIMPTGKVLTGK
jgi:hypothetical protein